MIEPGSNAAELVSKAPEESVPYINVAEVREAINDQYPQAAAAAVLKQAAGNASPAEQQSRSNVISLNERRAQAVAEAANVVAWRLSNVA